MANSLKSIIESSDSKTGFAFDIFIQVLIVVSLILLTIDTLPDLTAGTRTALWYSRLVIVLIFTAEYLLRIYVADSKLKFIFSFYGIVDLLAILPFYISAGVDLRSLRAFRLLRLFQTFKLVRYSKAVQRYHVALLLAWEELVLFLFVSLIMIYFAAAGIHYFENQAQPEEFASIFHSLWWAVVTLTTVGYGDVYPVTVGGRIFTFAMLMIALGVVSIPAGIMASALQEARELEKKSSVAKSQNDEAN
jgi:voltage-gated potassium channel